MFYLAAKDGDEVGTCDIEGAYLVPDLLPGEKLATPEDQCLFSRGEGASRVMAGSHVDDIISKGKSAALDRFYAEFQSKFRITIQRGPHISYTGLSITRQSPRAITVAQKGYRRTLDGHCCHALRPTSQR